MRLSPPLPIEEGHSTSDFSCGEQSLDDWLKDQALKSERMGSARTFVVCSDSKVIGYYCLSSASASREDLPRSQRHGRPRSLPCILLGRLGVHIDYQRSGLGQSLVKDAFQKCCFTSNCVGVMLILVDALNDKARSWWMIRYGFKILSKEDPYRLYLPMETVRKAIVATPSETAPGAAVD